MNNDTPKRCQKGDVRKRTILGVEDPKIHEKSKRKSYRKTCSEMRCKKHERRNNMAPERERKTMKYTSENRNLELYDFGRVPMKIAPFAREAGAQYIRSGPEGAQGVLTFMRFVFEGSLP